MVKRTVVTALTSAVGLLFFTTGPTAHAQQAAPTPAKAAIVAKAGTDAPTNPAAQDDELKLVLSAMDHAAAGFRSAQLNFRWDTFEAIVGEHTKESGDMYVRKNGNRLEMEATVTSPSTHRKTVLYKGDKIQLYQPATGEVSNHDVAKYRDQAGTFLLLGMGLSGKQLLAQFEVRYAGKETVDGVMLDRLELRPTVASVKQMFDLILLWIDPARGLSRQQQFFQPGREPRDYRLVNYSEIQINAAIPKTAFQERKPTK